MVEVPFLDDYLKHMEKIELASKYTLTNYPIHLRNFFEFTNGRYNVNNHTINKYRIYLLEEKQFARSTVNAKLSCLRSYFHFLYNEEHVDRNIAEKIELLDLEEKEPKKLITQEKVFKILDSIDDLRDRALLETLYATGVREGELSALNIEHIDFNNNLVTVLKGKGKKGGKTRVIPINNTALKWLKAYMGARKSGPLFLNNRSTILGERSIYNIVTKYFPFSPHDLRHCFATHLIKKTGNMKGVSQMLGHSSLRMTEFIYTHLDAEDLKDIYKSGGMDR
jgi:integrase/recombinase XerC/integrase/recombinase XerD